MLPHARRVQIHRGVFDSGHYFSFIKTRDRSSIHDKEIWNEFNAATVRPFDPANIPSHCFGGTSAQNAFLLYYDRVPAPRTVAWTEAAPPPSGGQAFVHQFVSTD